MLLRGAEAATLETLVAASGAAAVFWNRRYDAGQRATDHALKTSLRARGVEVESFNGHLLREPWTVLNEAGRPFQVFSAYWRACRRLGEPGTPLPEPARLAFHSFKPSARVRPLTLAQLALEPRHPDWAGGFRAAWQVGEDAGTMRLRDFIDDGLRGYAGERDTPGAPATSRLSPYLRFGVVSARQVWSAALAAAHGQPRRCSDTDLEKFQSELGWREFCHYQLFHFPDLATRNFRPGFDAMPWLSDADGLDAWQRGQTGYPLVDAGMRELWQTGWMHNRVRMIAASFLIKHLLIDWRLGEQWFWDTLADADPASNPANWQWVAGSGVDAAPYFRIFNPVLQGQKFDPDGDYVRRWVPELAHLPSAAIHRPWTVEAAQRRGYPAPLVDHDLARRRALDALAKTRR